MNIAHNMAAMNANRMYGVNYKKKASVTEKLSSGYRINRAADDAAGLSISEKMRRQIRGLTQGVKNTQEGVSLCQVADGALSEVSDILHRITELSVKSANGTYEEEDRHYIQKEITQLLAEIDRVGNNTKFNERPIFKGVDRVLQNSDGSDLIHGNIPFSDFSLADVDLGMTPFGPGNNADQLRLQAIVNNVDSGAHGKSFNLIFGNGSTSNSSFRITDSSGQSNIVKMESLVTTNYSYDNVNQIWSRDFDYNMDGKDLTITQKVKVEDSGAEEKNYVISYEIQNNQPTEDVRVEFMFHTDTAYNNDDRCEGYFIEGNRINEYCVYSEADSPLTDNVSSAYVDKSGIPDSFSIVDVDNALAFSEKISFVGNEKPDSISIGHYSRIDDWSYYDDLDTELGQNAIRADLGFSLYYNMELNGDDNKAVSFKYGIVATDEDQNLDAVTINKNNTAVVEHSEEWSLWIQSGCEVDDGLELVIGEMNTEVLGIQGLDVTTVENAKEAMKQVKDALYKVNHNRSGIGAQQNRLEHIINNENNIVENTTAAESTIRDADMAQQMVEYSKLQILEQVGQAVMSQANQSGQGVLSLLQ